MANSQLLVHHPAGNAVTVPVAKWLGERLANPYQVCAMHPCIHCWAVLLSREGQSESMLHCSIYYQIGTCLGTKCCVCCCAQYKYHGVGTQDKPMHGLLSEKAPAELTTAMG